MNTQRYLFAACGLAIAVLAAAAGLFLNEWLYEREQRELLNGLHRQDSLRIVQLEDSTAAAYRRLAVAKNEKELLERLTDAQAADIRRLKLQVREVHDVALRWREQFVGATTPALVGADTELPVDFRDRDPWIAGALWLRDYQLPADVPVDVELEAGFDSLGVRVAILEEPGTGGLLAQVTTSNPNVGVLSVEGVTDLRSTGAERKRRSFFDGFGSGVVVGAGAVGVVLGVLELVGALGGE